MLLSYLSYPLRWRDDNPGFLGHTNAWTSREIARIFVGRGLDVDAINYNDLVFHPRRTYDVAFDICWNLARLMPFFSPETTKILLCTGSDPYYQNSAELARIEEVNWRRAGSCQPRRVVANPEMSRRSMEVADACALNGNNHTLQTYPVNLREKMTLVTVCASPIGESVKGPGDFVPAQREFLWFNGSGAVHKGLDLVLEVFARNPDLRLNVVGNVVGEEDFVRVYHHELFDLPNVRYHGWLFPSSAAFRDVTRNCFCLVAPTCSEGISTAVVTCMQVGLYPIITRDSGVTLPWGCGMYLEKLEIDELEGRVLDATGLAANELSGQIGATQEFALGEFSHEAFHKRMSDFLASVVPRG